MMIKYLLNKKLNRYPNKTEVKTPIGVNHMYDILYNGNIDLKKKKNSISTEFSVEDNIHNSFKLIKFTQPFSELMRFSASDKQWMVPLLTLFF